MLHSESPDPVYRFISRLERLDTAGRARLKRNAGRTINESRNVFDVFFAIMPQTITRDQEKAETYFLVATLYAFGTRRDSLRPGNPPRSLGASLRRIRGDGGDERRSSLDKRVEALLEADREQLPFRLRQIVSLLKANEVAVNWPQLLRDILWWESPLRSVQRRWAEDFYVGAYELPTSSIPAESESTLSQGEL